MRILVADTAGFCMGVRRAVDIACKTAERCKGKVYTLGELIHNRRVVAELLQRGVSAISELPASGTVIIRAHGVAQQVKDSIVTAGLEYVDATCPHVLSSQKRIAAYSPAGATVVILGDHLHPEVKGLAGYARGKVHIIDSLVEAEALELPAEFLFIAQTTFSKELFDTVAAFLSDSYPECTVVDSICDATAKRQQEARALSRESDLLVVVGGRNSANTRRLAEIGLEEGARVLHIESAAELSGSDFYGCNTVGITAGASTPEAAVREVVAFISLLPDKSKK